VIHYFGFPENGPLSARVLESGSKLGVRYLRESAAGSEVLKMLRLRLSIRICLVFHAETLET
jgi:hypothetical protein